VPQITIRPVPTHEANLAKGKKQKISQKISQFAYTRSLGELILCGEMQIKANICLKFGKNRTLERFFAFCQISLVCGYRPIGTDRPTASTPCGWTDRGPMHRPRVVSGGPNIGRSKPVRPKLARPGTSLHHSNSAFRTSTINRSSTIQSQTSRESAANQSQHSAAVL
jgi:hypothetical protein